MGGSIGAAMGSKTDKLSSDEAREILAAAIRAAEEGNRGEVRVHLEQTSPVDNALERAKQVFAGLEMHKTQDDTGVLLYVGVDDRKVAVYAGTGIHGAAKEGYWQEVASAVAKGFKESDSLAGLCDALDQIGDLLREHVPGADEAGDELPNKVTTS
jgi:uncharacterized membrane protein